MYRSARRRMDCRWMSWCHVRQRLVPLDCEESNEFWRSSSSRTVLAFVDVWPDALLHRHHWRLIWLLRNLLRMGLYWTTNVQSVERSCSVWWSSNSNRWMIHFHFPIIPHWIYCRSYQNVPRPSIRRPRHKQRSESSCVMSFKTWSHVRKSPFGTSSASRVDLQMWACISIETEIKTLTCKRNPWWLVPLLWTIAHLAEIVGRYEVV